MNDLIHIGSFNLVGSEVIVMDPCYYHCYKDSNCGIILKAKPGVYNAYVKYDNRRVSELYVVHESSNKRYLGDLSYASEIDVDSGQAMIADYSQYLGSEEEYSACCDCTERYDHAGILGSYGVVSSTGWGDGSYIVESAETILHEAVVIKITFMGDEGNDE